MPAKRSIPRVTEQVHSAFLLASIHQSYGTRQTRVMAPGKPNEKLWHQADQMRLMAGWKFHLAQLTKSFPTDFNYLGPRWNGPLLGAGVNATKYQKPWPRTDIIVRWPHDCLSPIMRWPQERPVQTVWGIGGGGLLFRISVKNWDFIPFRRGCK